MSLVIRFAWLLALLLTSYSAAACDEGQECVSQDSWQLGLAVGFGVKSNPLVGGDNIPLIVLPDVAWYGENAYFDNGELGYQWIEQPTISLESFVQLDTEGAFFNFLHPANIFAPLNAGVSDDGSAEFPISPDADGTDAPEENESPERLLSINNIADRNWALNGGVRFHYFFTQSEITIATLTDISKVHQGQQLELTYQYRWQWMRAKFQFKLGANWKSADLIDYYYGVNERDTNNDKLFFTGKAGWQPYLDMSAQYPIDEHWMWIANLGYRKLPSSLYSSPLIENDNVKRLFFGVAYRY